MIFARRIIKRLENRYCSRPFDFRFRYRGYAVVVLGLLVKAVSEWIHAFALILQYVARVPLQKRFFSRVFLELVWAVAKRKEMRTGMIAL